MQEEVTNCMFVSDAEINIQRNLDQECTKRPKMATLYLMKKWMQREDFIKYEQLYSLQQYAIDKLIHDDFFIKAVGCE